MFTALLLLAVLFAVLVARLPRGGGRAFAAGGAVLALSAAALLLLRRGSLPGHRARPWRSPS
ncbi:hypothetical protein [Roseomonas sp. HF4]|uniref:hypothetical protein n=1 Tax=Roseomonas sp. HF4 TaxID=2562313 RepID=UPI0010C00462|nr:hypothetical protein [Roseomonas sp. HF4]